MTDETAAESGSRTRVLETVLSVPRHDRLAGEHLDTAAAWIRSGAPLWRTAKPATPPIHLVSYFVPFDAGTGRLLLGHHRLAGLLLPPGGHVEPGEDPWDTVVREAGEELRFAAQPGGTPLFLTVTATVGAHPHTDVSLWYVLPAEESDIVWFDDREYLGVEWLSAADIQARPAGSLDPHMARFLSALNTLDGVART